MRFRDILLPQGTTIPVYSWILWISCYHWVSGIIGDYVHVHASLIPVGIAIPMAFLKPVNLRN